MWTDATREKYEREAHRYASDLSDTEWCVIEPHMPPARALGRPRKTDMREVMTAILYMARSGCQWRMLPGEFPPRSSVQYYFYKWRDDGTWQEVNRALLARIMSWRWPGSSTKRTRHPSASTRAMILVVNPPRDRPMA